jgi:hypothetical protein
MASIELAKLTERDPRWVANRTGQMGEPEVLTRIIFLA